MLCKVTSAVAEFMARKGVAFACTVRYLCDAV
jgi:hypothetical protein